jgi:hypothetical protein
MNAVQAICLFRGLFQGFGGTLPRCFAGAVFQMHRENEQIDQTGVLPREARLRAMTSAGEPAEVLNVCLRRDQPARTYP